jgi:hypothetical protein
MLDASETYLLNFDIDEYYWDLGDGTKTVGEVIYHSFSDPGIYEINLGVLPDPDSMNGQQRYCSYKNIVVLETPGDETGTNAYLSQPVLTRRNKRHNL